MEGILSYMFVESLFEKIISFFRTQRLLPAVVAGFGVLSSVYGVSTIYSTNHQIQTNEVVAACPDQASSINGVKQVVSIIGAIASPGLYSFDSDTRIGEAVAAAGGMTKDADELLLQKTTPLARPVKDGESIFIPSVKERDVSQLCEVILGAEQKDGSSSKTSGSVSVNSATQKELEALTGIGEKKAEAIIEARPIASFAQLTEKGVLSEALIKELEGVLVL